MGLLDRNSKQVRLRPRRRYQQPERFKAWCASTFKAGSYIFSDAWRWAITVWIANTFINVIDHAESYVDGNVHTNTDRKLLVAPETRC